MRNVWFCRRGVSVDCEGRRKKNDKANQRYVFHTIAVGFLGEQSRKIIKHYHVNESKYSKEIPSFLRVALTIGRMSRINIQNRFPDVRVSTLDKMKG